MGVTISTSSKVLLSESDRKYQYPKAAPADSTPELVGSVVDSVAVENVAWNGQYDTTWREQLATNAGARLVGLSQGGSVQSAIRYITPEMFGADGTGNTPCSAEFQTALNVWRKLGAECVFTANGTYLLESPIVIFSPGRGSSCYINTLVKFGKWVDEKIDLFSRKGSLIILSNGGNSRNTWGAKLQIDCLIGENEGDQTKPTDFHIHAIRNLGWQQCCIEIGYVTGFISTVQIVNSEATTPTCHYKTRMVRNNLFHYLGNSKLQNMHEGCVFETMWATSLWFGVEVLGEGSAYTQIRGGSADFSGSFLSFITLKIKPVSVDLGMKVYKKNTQVGWIIGTYFSPDDYITRLVVAEYNRIADATGSSVASAISVGDVINYGSVVSIVTAVSGPNESHASTRFLPTSICIAKGSYAITRWNIQRGYDSGNIFSTATHHADAFIYSSNEVKGQRTPLPQGGYIDGSSPQSKINVNGSRYATKMSFKNLALQSFGGFNTATHGSVWRHNGAGSTVLVADGTSKSVTAFTAESLGYGQISGRIIGRTTDPVTDIIGLWEITGFGENTDGSLCVDKWTVLKNGSGLFKISKHTGSTSSTLTSTEDLNGNHQLALNASINITQANAGEPWQYRMTAIRTFML